MITRSDIDSARTMLSHLGRSTKHYHERELARKKVKIEISRLKKISTKSMKKYIKDLEHSIGDAIKKEQRILKHQKQDDMLQGTIRNRIKELEGRIGSYVTVHEARTKRLGILEKALSSEQHKKLQQLTLIKKSLKKAEQIHKSASKGKKYSKKQLSSIKKTLDGLRKKVKAAEKNL